MTNVKDFETCMEGLGMKKDIKEDITDAVLEYIDDEELLLYYDKQQNDEAIRRGDISLARKEGREEGINQRNIEIVQNMLKKGIDIDTI